MRIKIAIPKLGETGIATLKFKVAVIARILTSRVVQVNDAARLVRVDSKSPTTKNGIVEFRLKNTVA